MNTTTEVRIERKRAQRTETLRRKQVRQHKYGSRDAARRVLVSR